MGPGDLQVPWEGAVRTGGLVVPHELKATAGGGQDPSLDGAAGEPEQVVMGLRAVVLMTTTHGRNYNYKPHL